MTWEFYLSLYTGVLLILPQKIMKVLQVFVNARNFLTTKSFLSGSSLAMDSINQTALSSETLKWYIVDLDLDSISNTTYLKETLGKKLKVYLNDTPRKIHQWSLNTRICQNRILAASV